MLWARQWEMRETGYTPRGYGACVSLFLKVEIQSLIQSIQLNYTFCHYIVAKMPSRAYSTCHMH
jgi:hypothetical protein